MRVVIDTNVFVSGLMLPASVPGRILATAFAGRFEVVLCEPMLEEISVALRYPKLIQALRFVAYVVEPEGVAVHVPGDRDDDVILATLVFAEADCLVTGDSDLLALADRYPIITPAQFAARHLP
jgi:putative PIN family toxin of toxin-antitoxin system